MQRYELNIIFGEYELCKLGEFSDCNKEQVKKEELIGANLGIEMRKIK